MDSTSAITRRSLLGSLGAAALATPALWSREARGAAPPKRFMIVWTPGGTIKDAWGADGSETQFTYKPILTPFEPWKQHVLTVSLNGRAGTHSTSCADCLTGTRVGHPPELKEKTKHNGWATGISIDQHVANHIGKDTRLKSMELGARVQLGPAVEIYHRMCYSGPLRPLPPVESPYEAFEMAFGGGLSSGGTAGNPMALEARLAADRSVIDFVRSQLDALKARLGAEDRQRLDHHLTHVREIERTLARPPASAATCGSPLGGDRIDWKNNDNLPEIIKLQMDIATAAFACDVTRVATLMITRGAAGLSNWPWIGVKGEHHAMSHDDVKNRDSLIKINRWYNAQVAYLIQRLKATPDGAGGSLLDSTLVLYTNEMATGSHNRTGVPNVLAGHAAGFKMGRHLDGRGRPQVDLYVSIANALGVPTTSFGSYSTGPLAGLT